MEKDEWIEVDEFTKYKTIGTNCEWIIIKYYGDAAYYSSCPYCGFTHSCYKTKHREDGLWGGVEYDSEKEYIYCPMCGEQLLNNGNDKQEGIL